LKPGNIPLKPDGSVKVLDFGLAKLAPGVIDRKYAMTLALWIILRVRPSIPDSSGGAVERVRMRTIQSGSGMVAVAPDSVLPRVFGRQRSPLPSSGFFPLKIYGGVWQGWISSALLAASMSHFGVNVEPVEIEPNRLA